MTLRIQRAAERKLVVFTLTGRIQADQVPELEALLQSSDGDIVLDLRDVRLVDRDAVRFLAQQEAGGAKLRNCSAYIREWISQERNRLQPRRAGNSGEPSGFEG
jgi:anti-anti-sigma regulatory factor